MEVKGIYGKITDNSIIYLEFVEACIHHADPGATVKVEKYEDKLYTVIHPSIPLFRNDIIYNLLGIHKTMKMKIIFSKSLALQKSITYSLFFQ